MSAKPLTIEALKEAGACSEGLAWITPILEQDPSGTTARKRLIEEKRNWWEWAIASGFDATSGVAPELEAAGLCQVASNSGHYGSASNSGYSGSASNSGYSGSASNSGNCGSASNSGNCGSASNTGHYGSASNTGHYGSASNSGDYGSASNSGYYGSASNSGNCGSASNMGYSGSASNTGDYGSASNSGYYGSAFSFGMATRVRGVLGTAVAISYVFDDRMKIVSGVIGEDGLEPDVWYTVDTDAHRFKPAEDQIDPQVAR